MNADTAARLERLAATVRDMEVSDRTANLIALQAMVIRSMLQSSPADTADFAALVAELMRG